MGCSCPTASDRLLSEAGTAGGGLRTTPDAFDHAARIAAQCSLDLDFTDVRFPGFPVPEGETPLPVSTASARTRSGAATARSPLWSRSGCRPS